MMEEAARLQIYQQGLYLFLRFNHLFFLLLTMILGKVSLPMNEVETTYKFAARVANRRGRPTMDRQVPARFRTLTWRAGNSR